VASRIAAGEVVERPASVLKELVENSLDAGSTDIAVEARGGGVSLIRVTDNGCGVPAGEVEVAFRRYATSKISRLDDLDSLSSLGFRGEALPSIAAVAEVELVTCTGDDSAGTYLRLRDGEVVDHRKEGRSTGTTITVRNLFQSLPARLKFLKSTATENSHIASVVSHYALAYPEVKFTLIIEGRVALRTAGSGKLIDAIIQVYGVELVRNMLEVGEDKQWEGGSGSIKVSGMTGSPETGRASREYLIFFVNRRWINSRLLTRAVEEAYHGLLMVDKHPVAIINIAVPPAEVDVNIHPTKSEIKFRNESAVFTAVQRAVRRALVEQAPVPKIEEVATAYRGWTKPSLELKLPIPAGPVVQSTPAFSLPALRLLGQISGSYIVAEGPDGLYLIDQHAAHERILFEKFQRQVENKEVEVQGLLEPVTVEVSPGQDEILKSGYEQLSDFGFNIEPFGERTYLVRTVPLVLNGQDWMGALKELLDSPLALRQAQGERIDWKERATISIACHSAVRAGQVLSDDEMRRLVRDLEQTALPNTCPHGRPTMIRLSSGQLEREFGRS
ncbi:MAG: DNA mismatch repair endonuclease MutL, partial [Chloroflexota bacterium]